MDKGLKIMLGMLSSVSQCVLCVNRGDGDQGGGSGRRSVVAHRALYGDGCARLNRTWSENVVAIRKYHIVMALESDVRQS